MYYSFLLFHQLVHRYNYQCCLYCSQILMQLLFLYSLHVLDTPKLYPHWHCRLSLFLLKNHIFCHLLYNLKLQSQNFHCLLLFLRSVHIWWLSPCILSIYGCILNDYILYFCSTCICK